MRHDLKEKNSVMLMIKQNDRMTRSSETATVLVTIIFHFLVATASAAPQGIPLPVIIRMRRTMVIIMRVFNVMLMQMNNNDAHRVESLTWMP